MKGSQKGNFNGKAGGENAEVPRYKQILKNLFTEQAALSTIIKAFFAEYLFTTLFIFLATGTITSGCHTADTASASGNGGDTSLTNVVPGSCFIGNTTTLLNIAFAFGFAIFAMVYAAASFSGGHLNPAVTMGFLLTAKISIPRAFFYIIFQCLGACTGSALVKAIDPTGFNAALGGANHVNSANGVIMRQAWGAEAILTCIFVIVVFAATDAQRATSTAHLPILAPLAIGITLFLCHLVAIPIDGCSVNPARSFGTSAVSHSWQDQWVFWVGPFSGAVLAAVIYDVLFRTRRNSRLSLHHEHDADAPASDGKMALPAYSGVQGQQETSQLTESKSGVASPEGGASLRGTSSLPGINERGDTMV